MSWGLILKEVYVNRVTKAGLNDALEEAESGIEIQKDKLKALVFSTPRDTTDKGEVVPWTDTLPFKLNECLEELERETKRKFLCEMAMNDPDNVIEDV